MSAAAFVAASMGGCGNDKDVTPGLQTSSVGKAVATAHGRKLDDVAVMSREKLNAARTTEEIGLVSLRGGNSVGEHTLMFFGEDERIEMTHRAMDRAIFARGALRAARWVAGRGPGLYDMVDVLELGDL